MSASLAHDAIATLYLLLPLVGGAVAHGLCMRSDLLAALARPIDAGRTLRGRRWFGDSKTWRGPFCVAAGAALVYALQRHVLHAFSAAAALEPVDYATLPLWLGAAAGAAAELAELPNSFVKRQLDIKPGATARGPLAAVFFVWDQIDLLLGYWLVLAAFVPPTAIRLIASVALLTTIHPLFTIAGYLLRMRPTWR